MHVFLCKNQLKIIKEIIFITFLKEIISVLCIKTDFFMYLLMQKSTISNKHNYIKKNFILKN